ncbi:HipA-like protein [Aequorivita sublithincola DSM 14238]|uniref:HipA-like protein n=1 Tax=Aequorivita sublithincola (strain DSM 14238 / LMG 21431 / ACAM 643 / 9-3) TaxID=746697 RepID=I3YZW8_AEQSU|nr:type II toxin-antitoxin system HipA family toxin [Aequorivita sublithincola]AFL82536.1 HipA-like protein [Aequorivita sublithincola DSM 14238]
MIDTATIKIWGETVGAVLWLENEQVATFEYAPSFVKNGYQLAPLKMPLQEGTIYSFPELRPRNINSENTFNGLPGLLADVLPDRYGNQLINNWLAQQGRAENSMNPIEKLCFIGTRGMGALEFEPATNSNKGVFDIEVDGLVAIAAEMLNKRSKFEVNLNANELKAMKDILAIGTSAGGARAKAIIAYNEITGEVKSGQATAPNGFKHYLLKLDGVDDVQFGTTKGYGRIEMAYYKMATDSGIDMMPSRLLEENGRAHFMTERFDREVDAVKHHIQTLCGIQHYDYNQVGAYSYEQLFQTMRLLRLPYPQAEQIFRRMVFNVIARNCDDHTKNFAFRLKQGSEWEITPAYDMCYAYRPGSDWVSKHALTVNGKRENITIADLLTVAKSMNIKKPTQIIKEINGVIQQWMVYAEKYGVENALKKKIASNLIDLK